MKQPAEGGISTLQANARHCHSYVEPETKGFWWRVAVVALPLAFVASFGLVSMVASK